MPKKGEIIVVPNENNVLVPLNQLQVEECLFINKK